MLYCRDWEVMVDGDGDNRNVLETVSDFVDSHIRLFRMIPWIVGCTGLLLMYRHSRSIFRRFNSASDIPVSVVAACVPLRGAVMRVSCEGVWVCHVPLWIVWSKAPGM